jgi:hypothetical protein
MLMNYCKFKGGSTKTDFMVNSLRMGLEYVKNNRIWVGCPLNNTLEQFTKMIDIYTKVGFMDPQICTIDISANMKNDPFISMDRYPYDPNRMEISKTSTRKSAIALYNLFNNNARNNQSSLFIDIPDMEFLSSLLTKHDEEVGYEFNETLVNNMYHLQLNKATMKNASMRQNIDPCITDTPVNTAFNGHTHPVECYYINNCVLGWFSGQDVYGYVISNRLVNFLVSVEGCYTLQLTSDFYKYLSTIGQTARAKIATSVSNITTNIQNERMQTCSPVFLNKNFKDTHGNIDIALINDLLGFKEYTDKAEIFINYMNNATLKQYVTNSKYDCKMFMVTLTPWPDIHADGGLKTQFVF